jgi:diketogulonate reductase-like aldo/keto reductase
MYTRLMLICSFSVAQLKEIMADGGSVPAVNQILFHPTVLSEYEDLLAFHQKHGIVTEGYSPLKPLRDGSAPGLVKVVDKIAKEHKVQPDQVLLAWSKALGVCPNLYLLCLQGGRKTDRLGWHQSLLPKPNPGLGDISPLAT